MIDRANKKPWLALERGVWEVNEQDNDTICVNIGGAAVEVDKLYGPLAAERVRVRIDINQAEWVIERRRVDNDQWEEKARWDCQESWPEDEGDR